MLLFGFQRTGPVLKVLKDLTLPKALEHGTLSRNCIEARWERDSSGTSGKCLKRVGKCSQTDGQQLARAAFLQFAPLVGGEGGPKADLHLGKGAREVGAGSDQFFAGVAVAARVEGVLIESFFNIGLRFVEKTALLHQAGAIVVNDGTNVPLLAIIEAQFFENRRIPGGEEWRPNVFAEDGYREQEAKQ